MLSEVEQVLQLLNEMGLTDRETVEVLARSIIDVAQVAGDPELLERAAEILADGG